MSIVNTFISRFKSFIPKSIICLREPYSARTFRQDVIAGITVGVIAIPFAIATAIGANVAPERGLFTAIVAGFLISALGGSRVQVGGPTSTFIVVLYAIIMTHGFEGMLVATIMAGVILIFFGFAGLGTYIKYIPYPVVTGFTTGIAVVIASSQIKELLGLTMASVPIDFTGKWTAYWQNLSTWNPSALIIGLSTLAIIIGFRRFRPRFPGPIIALVAMGFITWLFNLNIDTIGSRFGTLPRSLPFPSLPSFHFEQMLQLMPQALTIALLAGIESLIAAVVSEGMTGWHHQSNTELVAQGLANIGSAIFGGMPASGSIARTAANIKSGGTTPIAGMVHAGTIFLIMFFLAPLASQIPLASLAAVLLIIAWNMSEIHHFLHLFTAPKRDIIVLVTVFLLAVFVDITSALQVGMILAAFLFMKQMSDMSDVVSATQIAENAQQNGVEADVIDRSIVPSGVEIYEINGPFFFGVADRLKNLFNQLERPPKIFILRMRKASTIDASGLHALEEFYLECRRQGTVLLLAGVRKNPLKGLRRYHLDQLIGEDHIFAHLKSALKFARELERVEKFKQAMR